MKSHWLAAAALSLLASAAGTVRAQGPADAPLTTGHATGFQTQGRYFQTLGPGPLRGAAAVRPAVLPAPALSPYINLLRRGADPAVNYYGLVRPIVEQQSLMQSELNPGIPPR
jgi:hypothetical protein